MRSNRTHWLARGALLAVLGILVTPLVMDAQVAGDLVAILQIIEVIG